jgi:hypothetical protein
MYQMSDEMMRGNTYLIAFTLRLTNDMVLLSDERISTVIEAPAPTVDNQVRSVS